MAVFITGASSGIGEACAVVLAKAGYDLVLAARRLDRLEALSRQLKQDYGISAHPIALDVRDPGQLKVLQRKVPEILSKVDIVINNAGLAQGRDPIQEGTIEDWNLMIDTNLKGVLHVVHAFLPQLIQKNSGHIVTIGSVAGHWVYPNGNVYCATKFAVRALNEALRRDLHGKNIRVTEISPGMVETEFSEVRFKGDQKKAKAVYAGKAPLKAEDIAETVLWCLQRPVHVNIQEVVVFPTEQPGVT